VAACQQNDTDRKSNGHDGTHGWSLGCLASRKREGRPPPAARRGIHSGGTAAAFRKLSLKFLHGG